MEYRYPGASKQARRDSERETETSKAVAVYCTLAGGTTDCFVLDGRMCWARAGEAAGDSAGDDGFFFGRGRKERGREGGRSRGQPEQTGPSVSVASLSEQQ